MKQIMTRAAVVPALIAMAGMALGVEQPTHAYIEVEGLACPFCVRGLEKHLKRVPGVHRVSTSLQKGEIGVQIKPGKAVTEKQLRQAVKKGGFTASEIRWEKSGKASPGSSERKQREEDK
jgi:copper chaperone CopZ